MKLNFFNSIPDYKLLDIKLKIILEVITLFIINFKHYLFFIKIKLNMLHLHLFLIENNY